ncbi:MAG: DNA polymerase III subunit gamma/tau [Lachnospiraceae bacterium]|nr:DNA polymerase III subunit gamma/tau [Lachnospiraceae bacterium]
MAYVALYRKWRPSSFDEVKGQETVVTTLKNQVRSGRIGHAYLFCGSRGTGKTSVAKILARTVNCENPADGCACGKCASCRSIDEGSSTNVIEIDAASNNGVDNVREIRDEVAYRPAEGKYRVYIIDEVHMLSPGAFNALLKTLEEPPEYVIFILATTEPHKIPATILSRCQRYDFHRITPEDIVSRLKELMAGEGIEAEEKALKYIARKADGALRDAISLFDQSISALNGKKLRYEDALKALGTVDSEILSRFLQAILLDDTTEALGVIEEVRGEGRELGQFVQDFVWYLRNLLLLMTADAPADLLEMSEEDWLRLSAESKMTKPEELMVLIRLFSSLYNDMRGAADKRILLEVATIRATRPATEKTEEALPARLTRLERKLDRLEKAGPAGGTGAVPEEKDPAAASAQKPAAPAPVRISPAQWEDLKLIKDNWSSLLGGLDHQSAQLLRTTWLEPKDGGVMGLVFPDTFTANMVKRFGVLEQLSRLIAEKYKKSIRFDLRTKSLKETEPVFAVSEEDLSQFHIRIETEDE